MPTGQARRYDHDVFVSYSHKDAAEFVHGTLVPRLRSAGISVFTDREFTVGFPAARNMEEAIESSRHTIAVVTPAWLASAWCEFEHLLAQHADPAARSRKLIPVLHRKCRLPKRLAAITYADLTEPGARQEGLDALVHQLAPETDEPKPKSSPVPDGLEALADALANRLWKEADIETRTAMASEMGRPRGLTYEDIARFPCRRLREIDELWLEYSKGRFGLSVQRGIWEDDPNVERFGEAIGWRAHGGWIAWPEVRFDDDAPRGHLPVGDVGGLLAPSAAMTLGRGVSGFIESQVEVVKHSVRDLLAPGGFSRLKPRLQAELRGRDGFALWWVAGRLKLLDRLAACDER